MEIGTIGAGRVAKTFARKAVAIGHSVAFSSHGDPDRLQTLVTEMGSSVRATTRQDAASRPMVLVAVPWPQLNSALSGLPDWNGRILIDTTNAFAQTAQLDTDAHRSSEVVAELAPGARVVKAMNATFMSNFEQSPIVGEFRRAIFVSGDHDDAVAQVADLFESLGYAPIDLGSLIVGGRMQAVGSTLAGHDVFLPWPAPRAFPVFNGHSERTR